MQFHKLDSTFVSAQDAAMFYRSSPSKIQPSDIVVPGDKSISHRAVMLAAIASGRSTVHGFLPGEDTLATVQIMRQLGVLITEDNATTLSIDGVGLHGLHAPNVDLNCGNAGTAMRLLVGLLSAQSFDARLVGDQYLHQRPMARVIQPLRSMGAHITALNDNFAPLHVHGGRSLCAVHTQLAVASAQVKSCLLLAGLYAHGQTIIDGGGLTRDHTERMLRAMQCDVRSEADRVVLNPPASLSPLSITIPGDLSSAAFFLVATAIQPHASMILRHVGVNPLRLGVVELLRRMGAEITFHDERLVCGEPVATIHIRSAPLTGIDIPESLVPLAIDELPVLMIAAACATGVTTLKGARELRVKETDRIAAMVTGLQALGIDVEATEDGMIVRGGQLRAGEVHSAGDHRIAMAFAIAGSVATGSVVVQDCDNVQTSFPNFVEMCHTVGLHVEQCV